MKPRLAPTLAEVVPVSCSRTTFVLAGDFAGTWFKIVPDIRGCQINPQVVPAEGRWHSLRSSCNSRVWSVQVLAHVTSFEKP